MPRATENDRLPYESSAFQAAIARRVAQMEADNAKYERRLKWSRRNGVAMLCCLGLIFLFGHGDPVLVKFLLMLAGGFGFFAALLNPKKRVDVKIH